MNTLRRITRHAAKASFAGIVMAAAALPLIGISAAGAATYSVPSVSYLTANGTGGASVPAQFGAGFSGPGTVVLSSADDSTLSGATLASFSVTPAGSTTASSAVSLSSGSIVTSTGNASTITTTVTASATAATDYYNLVVTDASGSITIYNAFYVATAPTITSITPTTVTVGQNGLAATLTGTGFQSGATVTLKSSTGATLPSTWSYASSTTFSGTINVGSSASGTYYVTVTNPDGGSATSTTVGVTVSGPTISSFSPSVIAFNSATGANNTTTVTVNGTGFQAGGYITVSETGASTTNATAGATTFVSATQLTFPLSVSDGLTGQVTITEHNPDGGYAVSSGTIGINENSASVTPTVTSVTPALTLAVGGSAQLTITGTGFGLPGETDTITFLSNSGLADNSVVCNNAAATQVLSDTTISCLVKVNSGAISGAHSVTVKTSAGNSSAAFANALTVAGPTITAVSPATVPVNYTGTYTLTGTGFPTTATNVPATSYTTSGSQASAAVLVNASAPSTGNYVGDTITPASGIPSSTTVSSESNTALTLSKATTAWLSNANMTLGQTATGGTATASTTVSYGTLPQGIAAGMGVVDTTTGWSDTGVTVTAVDATAKTITLSKAETVVSTDTLTFSATVVGTQTPSAVITVGSTANLAAGQIVTASGNSVGTVASVDTTNGTVTLTGATSAPVAAGTSLTFSFNPSTTYDATITSYDAAGNPNGGPTSTTATVTSATSMTVQGLALTGVAGGMYVITVAFSTGTVNVSVPEVVAPIISGIAYASSSITSVGQGATGQTVYIQGSGFLPGVTVSFPSTSGLSATVTSVTPNVITLSVSATSSASSAPVTVTNTTGGSVTSSTNVIVSAAPTITSAVPASVVAGATATTITLIGTGFVSGATVTSSSSLLTITAVTFVSSTKVTFSASGPAINGTVNVGLTLTLTNPNGGTATVGFSINPQPTVTGVYYVPTFSTNYELSVTGTGFSPTGMTVTSSNTDYSVYLAAVNGTGTAATLLVTTTSSATAGTSSNVTFTNPDGSSVTFKLNGGPVPTPTPTKTLTLKRVVGVAVAGRTRILRIYGTGFYGRPTVRSNQGGTRALVIHDNGKMLTVRVTVRAGSRAGMHVFTVILKNGQRNHINYRQR